MSYLHTFAATDRQNIWGTLGADVSESRTTTEVFERANLNGWNVRKTPAYFMTEPVLTEDGVTPATPVEVPGKFATVFDDPISGTVQPLGVVGRTYTPVQNEEIGTLLDALIGESGAVPQTAGSMRGGRDVFVSMKLPESMKVITPEGVTDAVDLNVVALNSHDGTGSVRLLVTPIRLACMNQQRAAFREAVSTVRLRHTRNVTVAIEEIRRALGLVSVYAEKFEESAQSLMDTPMDVAASSAFFARLTGSTERGLTTRTQNTRSTLALALQSNLLNTRTLSDDERFTRWGVYQAVTEYVDHLAPARGGAVQRATRVAQGGDLLKETAFDLLAV